jgi:hypothetical protein
MDPKKDEVISLAMKELSQSEDSSWIELDATDPNLSKFPLRSCSSWVKLPPESIPVGAYKMVPFTVQIDVPAGTRGFYFAAIVASTEPRLIELDTGVVTQLQFQMVVPVVLEVQSMVMPAKVSLTDVAMTHRAATPEEPAMSFVTMNIDNTGGTFSALRPIVRLWGQSAGHWRKVAELNLNETGILPGAKLKLRHEVGKPLPSGTYRMEGFLYVDSRRAGRVQKDLNFQGDAQIAPGGPIESPLDLEPSNSFLEIVPGATRSSSIQVVNNSEEGVTVNLELALPMDMRDRSNGRGVRGDDLSCADWVTVEPRQFTMRGYSRQNLRVVARMPKGASQYPCYYGTLRLRGSYADGQPAGMSETYICVQNKQVTSAPLVGATVLTIAETSPSRYLVTAGYMNGGETYVTPGCQGVLSVAGQAGVTTYKRFMMTSEGLGPKKLMLPFEARVFTGVLDVSEIPAGKYFVTSILSWPGGAVDGIQKQQVILVEEQGGRKYARLTEAQEPVPIKL